MFLWNVRQLLANLYDWFSSLSRSTQMFFCASCWSITCSNDRNLILWPLTIPGANILPVLCWVQEQAMKKQLCSPFCSCLLCFCWHLTVMYPHFFNSSLLMAYMWVLSALLIYQWSVWMFNILFLQPQLIQNGSGHKQLPHLPKDCLHHLQVIWFP